MSFWQSTSFFNNPHVGELYKAAEGITGPHARLLLEQAGLSKAQGPGPLVILDNACGTGVVSSLLYNSDILDAGTKENLQLTCGDFSEGMVKAIQEKIDSCNWKGAKAQIVDAQKMQLPDESFTHTVTSFGIMFMPDHDAVFKECFRVIKPGGVCAFSTWQSVGWIPDFRAAIDTIPDAPKFPETEVLMASLGKGEWYRPAYVEHELRSHGFEDIKVQVKELSSPIESIAAHAELLLGMITQLTVMFWTEEQREEYGQSVEPALLKHVSEKYGEEKPFELTMTSILATARKPTQCFITE